MIPITYLNVIVSILSQFSEKLYLKNPDLVERKYPEGKSGYEFRIGFSS